MVEMEGGSDLPHPNQSSTEKLIHVFVSSTVDPRRPLKWLLSRAVSCTVSFT